MQSYSKGCLAALRYPASLDSDRDGRKYSGSGDRDLDVETATVCCGVIRLYDM